MGSVPASMLRLASLLRLRKLTSHLGKLLHHLVVRQSADNRLLAFVNYEAVQLGERRAGRDSRAGLAKI